MMKTLLAFLFAALPLAEAAAAPAYYVSQRAGKAYLREGPSYAHRVLWEYSRKGTPFRVGTRYDIWRKVTAADGTTGWMSAAMLTDKRTVLVMGNGRAKIFASPEGGKLVGLAEPGAIADVKACAPRACRITARGIDGWIGKTRIWGVDADEVFR